MGEIYYEGMFVAKFPTTDWVQALMEKLNSDEQYARIAHKWEGDMNFVVEPAGAIEEERCFYLDLWHGKCRDAYLVEGDQDVKPMFTLRGPYDNYARILKGDIEPMQALMTRKISVKGNMAVLMRSVPTVLDFVRCCREVTDSFV
jgi:putative sterol carrier protein